MIRRATLATRLTIGAVVVALVPLIALAVTFGVLGERAIRREIDAALLARAQNFAALVQSSILEPLGRDNVLRSWSTPTAWCCSTSWGACTTPTSRRSWARPSRAGTPER